jgi:hypothetical protein
MKAVIIGCGNIAESHAIGLIENGIDILFFDIDQKKSKSFAARHEQKSVSRIPPAKKVYVVCVPTENHLSVVESICREVEGATIVIEKPVGTNLRECQKIIDIATASNNGIITTYQRRFDMTLRALSDIKADITMTCYSDFEWLCHYYDMLSWYGGGIKLKPSKKKVRTLIQDRSGNEIPRQLDNAYINFYYDCLNGNKRWLCLGENILKPHLLNEYEISHKGRQSD